MRKIDMRAGIAMIELIFAIVVMGIVLMSAPMLISTATKSGYVALQQEAIAAASSEIGMILTLHWDGQAVGQDMDAPILSTAGDTDLNETLDGAGNPTIGTRAGTPASSQRSFLTALGGRRSATATTDFGTTPGDDMDDIDDFSGGSSTLTAVSSASMGEGDYIDQDINILTTVSYINDTPTGGSYAGSSSTITLNNPFNRGAGAGATSNIKLVNIRLTTDNTSPELNKTIILNAFTCNIGTYELKERTF